MMTDALFFPTLVIAGLDPAIHSMKVPSIRYTKWDCVPDFGPLVKPRGDKGGWSWIDKGKVIA